MRLESIYRRTSQFDSSLINLSIVAHLNLTEYVDARIGARHLRLTLCYTVSATFTYGMRRCRTPQLHLNRWIPAQRK